MKNTLKKIVGSAFASSVGATIAPIVGATFAPTVGATILSPLEKVDRPSRGGRIAAPTVLLLALTFGLAGAAGAGVF